MRTLLRDLGTVTGVQSACIVRGGEVLASSFPENDAVSQAASLGFVRGISDGLELVDRGFEELLVDFGGKSLMVTPVEKDFVLATIAAPDANLQLLRVVMGSSVRQLRRMHDIAEKAEAAPAPAAAAKPAAQGGPAPAPSAPTPSKPAAAAPAPPPQAGKPQQPAPPPPPQQAGKPQPTGRPQPPQQAKPAPPPPPPLKGQQAPRPQQPAQTPPQQPPKPAAKPEPTPTPAAAAAAKVADKDAEPILPQVLALLTEYIGPVARVSFKRGVTRWRETSTPTVGTLGELAKILAADLSTDSEKKAFLDAVERLRGM